MKRFGTFEGVFTPCLLSILGVIMYLRLGWVVGQVGLFNCVIIIFISNIITIATALSMSSIVTNIRIGAGGAYSIITKSLGVEAGGAIGVPLYLSQAISVAFYISGFAEVWRFIFPEHSFLIVSLLLWFVLLVISYISAKLAFRIQYVIMLVILLSLIGVVWGSYENTTQNILWEGMREVGLWEAFSIFFPAVTGVLAGAAMSGELKNPRDSIPRGTLWAIGVSLVIYLGLAYWFASHATPQELVQNRTIIIDFGGPWRWIVIAGIMGATISSGLAMFIGSPRTLMALGKNRILPFSSELSQTNKKGEPTTAILVTALISLITLMLGSLDSVAALLTMFFLITYGMINCSVFIEDIIGIPSFRPTFRVPRIISFLGFLGCGAVMFIVNPMFTFLALAFIVIAYYILLRVQQRSSAADVRSGLLIFLAEQLALAAAKLPYHPKIWKPNFIIPVYNRQHFKESCSFVRSLVVPRGRLIILDLCFDQVKKEEHEKIWKQLMLPFHEHNIFAERAKIDFNKSQSIRPLIELTKGTYFPPNTMFITLGDAEEDYHIQEYVRVGIQEELGIVLLARHPEMGFAQEEIINLWFRRESPNIDLSVLTALQLKVNWDGQLRVIMVVANETEVAETEAYLHRLQRVLRLPLDVTFDVLVGRFIDVVGEAPSADINIFGMPVEPEFMAMRGLVQKVRTSVLFLRDSSFESAIV